MSQRRTTPLTTLLLLASALLFPTAPALAEANLSLTVGGSVCRVLTNNAKVRHDNGAGPDVLLEFQPADFFSIGLQVNVTEYFGTITPNPSYSGFSDVVIRLMPYGYINNHFCPYFLLGGGVDPFTKSGNSVWPGDYHAMAGMGFRYFFDPHWALDMGATYQFLTPTNDSVQTLNGRVGISYFIGEVKKVKPHQDVFYLPGSLQAIAAHEWGDPDLYPILIDANFKGQTGALMLKPGAKFIIPKNLTQDMMANARERAVQGKYLELAATFSDPTLYTVTGERITPIPYVKNKRTSILYKSDTLWDIAARPDVYGDPELYPLLVDANLQRLKKSTYSKEMLLTVPQNLSAKTLKDARLKAWAVEYILWRGKNVTQKEYQEWRSKHGLPLRDEKDAIR